MNAKNKNDKCDILFLYRTPKKKKYFKKLSKYIGDKHNCKVYSYHELPTNKTPCIPEKKLKGLLKKSLSELFNAHQGRGLDEAKWVAKKIRIIQIKKIYCNLYNVIQSTSPKIICIWNGHKFQDNILRLVNESFKIPIAYFENGLLPNSTTMDFCGVNACNSIPRDPKFFDKFKKKTDDKEIKGREYRKTKRDPDFKLPCRYFLVPFQLDRDSQILENSPWIKSMSQLYTEVASAVKQSQHDDIHIVFRTHPTAKTKYKKLHRHAKNQELIHFDQQSNLCDVIENAEAVITINSSVGLESLMLGRKVITLGDAYYNIDGLVKQANNAEQLVEVLNDITHFKPDQDLISRFLSYLEYEYVIPGSWKSPNDRHLTEISRRLETKLG